MAQEGSLDLRTRVAEGHGVCRTKVPGGVQERRLEAPVEGLGFCSAEAGALCALFYKQERPAVADKPARRLRNVCTVYCKSSGVVSCIASLPIDSLRMVSY